MTPETLHELRKKRLRLTFDQAAAMTGASRRKLVDYERPDAVVPRIVARAFASLAIEAAARRLVQSLDAHPLGDEVCEEIKTLNAALHLTSEDGQLG